MLASLQPPPLPYLSLPALSRCTGDVILFQLDSPPFSCLPSLPLSPPLPISGWLFWVQHPSTVASLQGWEGEEEYRREVQALTAWRVELGYRSRITVIGHGAPRRGSNSHRWSFIELQRDRGRSLTDAACAERLSKPCGFKERIVWMICTLG